MFGSIICGDNEWHDSSPEVKPFEATNAVQAPRTVYLVKMFHTLLLLKVDWGQPKNVWSSLRETAELVLLTKDSWSNVVIIKCWIMLTET